MTTDDVTREVSPLLGTRWGYADDYRAFIGPRCPVCSTRGCSDPECVRVARDGVAATMTGKEVAAVLGVSQ